MQWIILDLAALAIFALCVFFAARNGFVQTILTFVSYIIALILASHFGRMIARWFYESVVENFVEGVMIGHFRQAAQRGITGYEFVETAPIWIRSFLMRMTPEEVAAINFAESPAVAAGNLMSSFLRDQILWILGAIGFLILFLLLLFLLRQFTGVFSELVDKIPIVGRLDHLLGGVLGAIQGIIILVLIAMLMHAINAFSGNVVPWINPYVINRGFIMRLFYHLTSF